MASPAKNFTFDDSFPCTNEAPLPCVLLCVLFCRFSCSPSNTNTDTHKQQQQQQQHSLCLSHTLTRLRLRPLLRQARHGKGVHVCGDCSVGKRRGGCWHVLAARLVHTARREEQEEEEEEEERNGGGKKKLVSKQCASISQGRNLRGSVKRAPKRKTCHG